MHSIFSPQNALLTTHVSTPIIERMNYYTYLQLDELGISSEEEAEELEYELELRFEDFTPEDRTTWLHQSAYFEHFSRMGAVSDAAKNAGVNVYTVQRWQYDNALGFTRRN